MSTFKNQVHRAVKEMGEAPYDDKKTAEAITAATKKTVELLKVNKSNDEK